MTSKLPKRPRNGLTVFRVTSETISIRILLLLRSFWVVTWIVCEILNSGPQIGPIWSQMAPKLPKMISTFFEYLTAQYCQNIHYMSYGSYNPFQLDQMIQRACCMIVLVSYLLPALICWTAVSWKSCTAITFGLQRKLPPPINPREKSETKFQVIWELCIITKSSNCEKGQQFQVKNRMVLQSMRGIKVSICRGKKSKFKVNRDY